MIDRPLVPGRNVGTVIAPTGSVSGIVAKSWLSVRADGGARVQAWFQKSARSDGPPPGAGEGVVWALKHAERGWCEIPSGTEYIQYDVQANGVGALAVELAAK